MTDPFDQVSIWRSTDRVRIGEAQELLAYAAQVTKDGWCVCRFLPDSHCYGFALRWVGLHHRAISVGSSADPIAVMDESTAEMLAGAEDGGEHIYRDRAVPLSRLTWRTMLWSRADGSRVEVYRGDDYLAAHRSLGALLASIGDGKYRALHACLEGVAALPEFAFRIPD